MSRDASNPSSCVERRGEAVESGPGVGGRQVPVDGGGDGTAPVSPGCHCLLHRRPIAERLAGGPTGQAAQAITRIASTEPSIPAGQLPYAAAPGSAMPCQPDRLVGRTSPNARVARRPSRTRVPPLLQRCGEGLWRRGQAPVLITTVVPGWHNHLIGASL